MSWLDRFKDISSAYSGSEAALNGFTPRAQQVLALARTEAEHFHHSFLGTEHVLLGLIKLGQGVAVNVLQEIGLDLETVRMEVEKLVGTGPDQKLIGNIPYTPRVKKVLSLAAKEAKALNHSYVGTEHLLLGLLCEGDGVAARVLQNMGVDVERVRREILKELNPNYSPPDELNPVATPETASGDNVDLTKRYDVYCREGGEQVIYRNALIKSVRALCKDADGDPVIHFMEIEFNDQTILIAFPSITKLCPPGTALARDRT
jgi:ATP-dependent Clp protease ATP-binding subunit ClpA